MVDYTSRTEPAIFKPIIDDLLVDIAEKGGGDPDAVRATLEPIDPEPYPQFSYFLRALRGVSHHLLTDKVRKKAGGHWFMHFLEGKDGNPPFGVNLEHYPESAKEALQNDDFVGGYDSDVVGLWKRDDGRESVYHAHMEGFWILGEDTIDFAESFRNRL